MQEELVDDTWIWRKCGEKSIRGSPFPRNYYRCSTSKDCNAKKQIEKSPKNDNRFLVAYYGEHNHTPPTKRSFVAGYNACSKSILPKGINIVPKAMSKRAKLSSTVVASPISPTTPALESESASPNKNEMAAEADEEEKRAQGIELQGVTAST
ncbi:hypothetical protein HAX54_034473 [Datura stramonium]|uniref:WRKY domain-containing protein n=1 Tax=Datura stramonium TaxID=4076 RepID=A0ABS8SEA0_DATST|nr:hypothetical protein [Datura stramonium]